jgi:hypothetical protein
MPGLAAHVHALSRERPRLERRSTVVAVAQLDVDESVGRWDIPCDERPPATAESQRQAVPGPHLPPGALSLRIGYAQRRAKPVLAGALLIDVRLQERDVVERTSHAQF